MIETKNHYLPGISFLFSGVLLCINYWGGVGLLFFLTRDQIFSSVEKPTVERLTLSHAIYPSTPFGPV